MLKNYVKVALKVFWRHKFFTAVNLLGICSTLIASITATMILDMEIGQVTGNAPPEIHNDRTLHLSTMVIGNRTGRGFSYGWEMSPGYAFLDRHVADARDRGERGDLFQASRDPGVAGWGRGGGCGSAID